MGVNVGVDKDFRSVDVFVYRAIAGFGNLFSLLERKTKKQIAVYVTYEDLVAMRKAIDDVLDTKEKN